MADEQKPLEIIGSPREGRGGSGFGVSYWERFHKCAKRGTLGDHAQEHSSGDADAVATLDAAETGTILHKLAEWWHSGQMTVNAAADPAALHIFNLPAGVAFEADNPNVEEAWRVFRYYATHYAADAFGEVVGVELPFGFSTDDTHSPVGVTPFTGRIDLAVKLNEEQAEALSRRILQPLKAGCYIIDHKSKGSKPSAGELMSFTERVQFHAYMMAWDVLFAAQHGRCEGTIANFMVRHKTASKLASGESFFQHLVPFPTPDQQQATRNWFRTAQRRKTEEGEMHADPTFCFDYNRACPWYTSGACKRY